MAALTAENLLLPRFRKPNGDDGLGLILDYPVAASTVIYRGGLVGLNTAGYLTRYAAQTIGTSVVGGHRLLGVALEAISSQATDGLKTCKVRVSGCFQYTVASTSIADVGKPVYASDDQTLTLTCAGNDFVGWILDFISGDDCLIMLDAYKPRNSAISRWTPAISVAAANIVTVIPKSWNGAGLFIREIFGVCTTDFSSATPVYTVQDTAGTTLGITFATATNTDALEAMLPIGTADFRRATQDFLLIPVPAGLGVNIVTTASGTGAAKFWIECVPV